jgi:peptidoglycan/LPS O-acetylase OafA/YrhL
MLLGALVGFIRHAAVPTGFHRVLESKYSQFLGRISYSYYLLNVPVLFVFWFTPGLSFIGQGLSPVLTGLLIGALALLATVPLAYLSQRYCEAPCINLGKRITRRFIPPFIPDQPA